MSVRVRFAPSPTGHLHVGNARTALFNYLYARSTGGRFILRIEDTDFDRSTVQSEELIYEDMRWLLMDWDEGPVKGGENGPYRQTERFDIYQNYANMLLEQGKAYKCFCTKEDLDKKREAARAKGETYIYDGKCRSLTKDAAQKLEADGVPYSVRFRVDEKNVVINDAAKGEIDFTTETFGDFVIIRPGGVPIYNFVVVIDDALMEITHVIRGDDHLSNTPKQALIFDTLGFSRPTFVHIPMVLGPDRSKLSKRHGNTSVEQFRNDGYLPEALFNYMALLAWSDEDEREILSKDELIRVFSLERVSSSATIFDFQKLRWMNGQYIRELSVDELFERAMPFIEQSDIDTSALSGKMKDILASVQDKLEVLSDAPEKIKPYFIMGGCEGAEDILELETTPAVLKAFKEKSAGKDNLSAEEYKQITKEIQKETGAKGKALFMAIRIGLTGAKSGPDMNALATILPVSEINERIDKVLALIEG